MKILSSFTHLLHMLTNKKHEIDSKEIKKLMLYHWNENGLSSLPRYVTKVQLFQEKDKFTLLLETTSPGLIIGKGGKCIDELMDFLRKTYPNLHIDLKECQIFHNLYR